MAAAGRSIVPLQELSCWARFVGIVFTFVSIIITIISLWDRPQCLYAVVLIFIVLIFTVLCLHTPSSLVFISG
jgi:hypothetical protein